ncbi:DUF6737 family protein [Prochlorococcus marinus]|uniref:DUF6737 family protein n=1 Tax=Prochlorococcus marinus TaxID=1219 RepID=UPI003B28D37E
MTFPTHNISFWSGKPFWCRPWSILLTGLVIIISTYFFIEILFVDILITSLIIIWWVLFLYYVPKIYTNSLDSSSSIDNE